MTKKQSNKIKGLVPFTTPTVLQETPKQNIYPPYPLADTGIYGGYGILPDGKGGFIYKKQTPIRRRKTYIPASNAADYITRDGWPNSNFWITGIFCQRSQAGNLLNTTDRFTIHDCPDQVNTNDIEKFIYQMPYQLLGNSTDVYLDLSSSPIKLEEQYIRFKYSNNVADLNLNFVIYGFLEEK